MSGMLSDKCFANPAWRRASRGYNMIELITAMSIVAIPRGDCRSLLSIYKPTRIASASEGNGLLGDLQYARAEAIKEGQSVSVCVSNDAHTCTVGLAWQKGWIVFSDPTAMAWSMPARPCCGCMAAFSGSDTFVATPNLSV